MILATGSVLVILAFGALIAHRIATQDARRLERAAADAIPQRPDEPTPAMLGEDSREVAWLRELAAKYVAGRLTVDEYLDRAEKVGTGFPGLDPGIMTAAYHDGYPAGASGAYGEATNDYQVFVTGDGRRVVVGAGAPGRVVTSPDGVTWSDALNTFVAARGNGCPGPGWQWSNAAQTWVPPEATDTEIRENAARLSAAQADRANQNAEPGTRVTYCPECHMAPPCPTTCPRSVSQFPRPTMEERR